MGNDVLSPRADQAHSTLILREGVFAVLRTGPIAQIEEGTMGLYERPLAEAAQEAKENPRREEASSRSIGYGSRLFGDDSGAKKHRGGKVPMLLIEHALKFYDFIHARRGRVVLQAIEQPAAKFGSPLEVFKQALGYEQKVTSQVNNLYELAVVQVLKGLYSLERCTP
jgi:ferritin-like protein